MPTSTSPRSYTSSRMRRAARSAAVAGIVERHRRAEDAQGGVALELVHQPAVALDRLDDGPEEAVEHRDELGRFGLAGQPRRPGDVDEQGDNLAALAAQRDAAGDRLAGDRRADVAAEQVLDPLALAQPLDHVVDAALQHADLADVVDLDGGVELAAPDQPHRGHHRAQRFADRPRDEAESGGADDERDDRGEQPGADDVRTSRRRAEDEDDAEQRDTRREQPDQQDPRAQREDHAFGGRVDLERANGDRAPDARRDQVASRRPSSGRRGPGRRSAR